MLGILNSALTYFLFRSVLPKLRGDFYEPSYVYLKDFPIRTINFSHPTDRDYYDKMVELVGRMLNLHKQLTVAKTPPAKTVLQRQIEVTDRQIDELVYKLYGLTKEEIELVEKSAGV